MRNLMVVIFLVMVSGNAAAGGGMGAMSTEVTQILNFAELTAQTDTVYEQWRVQYDRMEKLKKQMEAGANIPFSQIIWAANAVARDVEKTKSIGYDLTTMTTKWNQLYPDFSQRTGTNYLAQYKEWNNESTKAIQSALLVNGLHSKNFDTEEAMKRTLATMAADANSKQSTVALINAGNSIALAQMKETEKLAQIQRAQNAMQAAYYTQTGQMQDAKTAQDDVLRQMFKDPPKKRTYQQIQTDNAKRGKTQ